MRADAGARFLRDEFFSFTLAAVAQRGNIYRPGLKETDRSLLHRVLRQELHQISQAYESTSPEADHVQRIVALSASVSSAAGSVLEAGRFRIGSAQKALNLYLKYLWCAGWIGTPPHCPFDAIVLRRVPGSRDVAWTRLDTEADYLQVVANAKAAAHGQSLAEWELALYNDLAVETEP